MDLPEGYDTVVGEPASRCPVGSASASRSRDRGPRRPDPDPGRADHGARRGERPLVSEAPPRLAEGRTTFLITHDLRQVATADQILYVEEGDVVERGTHTELLGAAAATPGSGSSTQTSPPRPGPEAGRLRGLGQGLRQQRDERLA